MFDLHLPGNTASHAASRQFLKSALNTVNLATRFAVSGDIRAPCWCIYCYLILLNFLKPFGIFMWVLNLVLYLMCCWSASWYISVVKPTWCTFYTIHQELSTSTCFEHYLLIFRRNSTNGTWYIAYVLCQLAAPGLEWNFVYGSHRIRPTRIHTHTHTHTHTHLVGPLWTSEQPFAEAATYIKYKKRT
jgi:hypothetical protein